MRLAHALVAYPQRKHGNVFEDRPKRFLCCPRQAVAGGDRRRHRFDSEFMLIGETGLKAARRGLFAQSEIQWVQAIFATPQMSRLGRPNVFPNTLLLIHPTAPEIPKSSGLSWEKAMMNSASVVPVFSK